MNLKSIPKNTKCPSPSDVNNQLQKNEKNDKDDDFKQSSICPDVPLVVENNPSQNKSIQLFIDVLASKSTMPFKFVMDICTNDTIKTIKEKINERNGFPIHVQQLMYNHQSLKDDYKTLSHYGITHESKLIMFPVFSKACATSKSMVIFVKCWTLAWTKTLDVSSSDSIEKVKELIEEKFGCPKDWQFLQYKYKNLDNNKTLSDYGINNRDKIIMLLRNPQPK